MSKTLLALGCLLCCVQGWTATLKGRIVSEDGRGISGAKILVINDFAAMMMLRGSSDRNGRYQFSVDPGHYRIFILKKGYQPINIKTLISHEQATFELNHDLRPEMDLTDNQNGDSLKRILRRTNREPNRDWTEPLQVDGLASLSMPQDESLQASISTSTYQSLQGEVSHQEKVQIKTRITPSVEVHSTLSQDRGDHALSARQIQAGVSLDFQHVQLDASASTIDSTDQHHLGQSREVQLSGTYGSRVQAQTQVSMTESETVLDRHRQLSIQQGLAYQVFNLPLRHDASFTEWDRNNQELARQARIATAITDSDGTLGLQADVDHLNIANESYTTSKLWGQIQNKSQDAALNWQTQMGIAAEADQQSLVQLHQVSYQFNHATLAVKHVQDTTYQAITAYDVFGDFARANLTPYINEAFYRQEQAQTELSLTLNHPHQWNSSITVTHNEQEANLLHSENAAFMNTAEMETTSIAYQLDILPYGSNLKLTHAQNNGNQADFNTTGITYAQHFSPFRMRDLNLIVELSIRNQPGVPAWWLLRDLPWNIAQTDTWYEGQLRVNF